MTTIDLPVGTSCSFIGQHIHPPGSAPLGVEGPEG